MSELYGSFESDATKTTATKRGHFSVSAHLRSWDHGVRISVTRDRESGALTLHAQETGGSNDPYPKARGLSFRRTYPASHR